MSIGSSIIGVEDYADDHDAPITTEVLPHHALEIEFDAGTWTNVTADLRNQTVSVNRGRNSETDQFRPGTMGFVLNNRARTYDPEYSAGIYSGKLKPNRRVRLRETLNGTTYDIYTGFIDRYDQKYVQTKEATCEISCSDAFNLLQAAGLPGGVLQAEIEIDLPVAWWKLDEPANTPIVYDTIGSQHLSPAPKLGVQPPVFGRGGIVARDSGNSMEIQGTTIDEGCSSTAHTFSVTGNPFTMEIVYQSVAGGSSGFFCGQVSYDVTTLAYMGGGVTDAFFFIFTPAGSATVFTSGANIKDDLPHHIVGVWNTDGSIHVWIDGVDRTGTPPTLTPAAFPSLAGFTFIGGGDLGVFGSDGCNGLYQHCAFYDHALTPTRILAHYDAMRWAARDTLDAPITTDRSAGQWAGDTLAARLNRILDVTSFSSTDRDFASADGSTYQATDLGGTVLAYLQKIEETEAGRFYVAASGKLAFRSRRDIWKSPYNLSAWTLGDAAGEIPYTSYGSYLDASSITNQAKVSRVDGVLQIATDAASRAEFKLRTESKTDLLNNDDTESLDHSNYLIGTYAQPRVKLPTLTINARNQPSVTFPFLLGLEIGTRITVNRRPQGVGSVISKEVIVEGIRHTISARTWVTELYVSEVSATKYWVLGDTVSSVLDTTTRLGY